MLALLLSLTGRRSYALLATIDDERDVVTGIGHASRHDDDCSVSQYAAVAPRHVHLAKVTSRRTARIWLIATRQNITSRYQFTIVVDVNEHWPGHIIVMANGRRGIGANGSYRRQQHAAHMSARHSTSLAGNARLNGHGTVIGTRSLLVFVGNTVALR